MPRKSAASLNVVPIEPNRLRPPANLPQAERDLFAQLVAANAPAHFKLSDVPLLTQYVTAAVLADRAAEELRVAPVVGGRPSPSTARFVFSNTASHAAGALAESSAVRYPQRADAERLRHHEAGR